MENNSAMLDLLYFLKENCKEDVASIEIFIASITGDLEMLKRSLDAGANPNLSFGQILKKFDTPEMRKNKEYVDVLAKYLIESNKK